MPGLTHELKQATLLHLHARARVLQKIPLPLRSANRESRMPVSVESMQWCTSWAHAAWHMTGLPLDTETGHKCKVAAGKYAC